MIILGIDPGLQVSGYAVLSEENRRVKVLDAGAIRTDNELPLAGRLTQIARDIQSIVSEYPIDMMAVEELYAHYKHPRTAILMGHARGVILQTAAATGIEVKGYAATRVKKSLVGHGRASKQQMQQAITQRLGLNKVPTPADVADALAIALCCLLETQQAQRITRR